MTDLSHVRNLSSIAHIDHGKSTLADRILEICGAVDLRDVRDQYLDSMDIDRDVLESSDGRFGDLAVVARRDGLEVSRETLASVLAPDVPVIGGGE